VAIEFAEATAVDVEGLPCERETVAASAAGKFGRKDCSARSTSRSTEAVRIALRRNTARKSAAFTFQLAGGRSIRVQGRTPIVDEEHEPPNHRNSAGCRINTIWSTQIRIPTVRF
jgi:hypothetical protein